jgi:hypothetical protein
VNRRRRIFAVGRLLILLQATSPVAPADDRILVEAKINGEPIKLAFDTGAAELVIFRAMAEKLGVKVLPPPPDIAPKPGEVVISRTEPLKIELFGQTSEARIGVFDHPAALPPDVDGLLGWSNVRQNIWYLSGSSLKFRGLPTVPAEAASWTKLRQVRDRPQQLCLELDRAASAPPAYLGIDTGASSGVRLSPGAWADWRARHPAQLGTLDAYYMPGAGLVVAEEFWAKDIDLGGLVLHDVPVVRMNEAEVNRYPPGTLAVLGLNAMKRMDAVLDGPADAAYLLPLATSPRPYDHNRLGAVFVPVDVERSNDLVAHVAPGSPAAAAGVRDGDALLMIDQMDVTPWRTKPGILPLSRFWNQPPGTKMRLTLRRGHQTLVVPVVLATIVGPR